jgi:hypothetical protein
MNRTGIIFWRPLQNLRTYNHEQQNIFTQSVDGACWQVIGCRLATIFASRWADELTMAEPVANIFGLATVVSKWRVTIQAKGLTGYTTR